MTRILIRPAAATPKFIMEQEDESIYHRDNLILHYYLATVFIRLANSKINMPKQLVAGLQAMEICIDKNH